MQKELRLFTFSDLFPELISEIKKAQHRVYLQAMVVELGKNLYPLAQALQEAAQRGIHVELHIDWYSKFYTDEHPNWMPIFNKEKRAFLTTLADSDNRVLHELEAAGTHITFTNKPKSLFGYLFQKTGRNHIKIFIVDDTAFIGGMNLQERTLLQHDTCIRYTDHHIVELLVEQFFKINEQGALQDSTRQLDTDSTLFIDAGKYNRSTIYDEAIRLINNAHHTIIFASQFLPHFGILKALTRAKERGLLVEVMNYLPTPLQSKTQLAIEQTLFHLKNRTHIPVYYYKKKIHAKILIADDTVLFGSHNYSKFGVLFGTNELAIKTKNKEILGLVSQWYAQTKADCVTQFPFANIHSNS